MEIDENKVDEMVLALLYLNFHGDRDGFVTRAWKSFDWDSMNRLHDQGFISDPKSKAKSVVMTEEGRQRSEELFARHFRAEA